MSHFAQLADEEWDTLIPHLSIITLKKHQYFIQQGSVANQIGFVVEGLFRQFYAKDGEERTT